MSDEYEQFHKGDLLKIESHKSKPGKGLSYPRMIVEALEDGFTGGWDVWDGQRDGELVSFYGFSVRLNEPHYQKRSI